MVLFYPFAVSLWNGASEGAIVKVGRVRLILDHFDDKRGNTWVAVFQRP